MRKFWGRKAKKATLSMNDTELLAPVSISNTNNANIESDKLKSSNDPEVGYHEFGTNPNINDNSGVSRPWFTCIVSLIQVITMTMPLLTCEIGKNYQEMWARWGSSS